MDACKARNANTLGYRNSWFDQIVKVANSVTFKTFFQTHMEELCFLSCHLHFDSVNVLRSYRDTLERYLSVYYKLPNNSRTYREQIIISHKFSIKILFSSTDDFSKMLQPQWGMRREKRRACSCKMFLGKLLCKAPQVFLFFMAISPHGLAEYPLP